MIPPHYAKRLAESETEADVHDIVQAARDDWSLTGTEKMHVYDAATLRTGAIRKFAPPPPPPSAPKQDDVLPGESELAASEFVLPLASPALAKLAMAKYQALAAALEDPADVVDIQGRKFRKKSFWRKIALAYGISLERVDADQVLDVDKEGAYWSSRVTVRATTRAGRHVDGVASCSNREPSKKDATAHVVYATAYTRAANRAIADLVAAGEVSAEEVE